MYWLNFSRLFEEHQEGQGGGGDPAKPPVFDPEKFRDEFKREIVGELDKRVNGLDKSFKKEVSGLSKMFGDFKGELATMLKPQDQQRDEEQHTADEQQGEDEKQQRQQRQSRQGGDENRQEDKNRQQQQPPQRKPQDDPRFLAMERELKELKAQRKQDEETNRKAQEAAERKEVDAVLRTEISKQKFNSDEGPEDLFALLRGKLTRSTEDGNLYGPEGLTVNQFVEKEYQRRPFLHPAKQVNGSGAPGSSATTGGPLKAFDLDNIKPGMSQEDLNAALAAVNQSLGQKVL